jgi:23S rRNA pseudouridine1911/1915/1917 synthase
MKRNDNVIFPLFQDRHLFACVKPAGMLTQPDDTARTSLEDIVAQTLQKQTGKPKVFVHPVHRLDRLVSGIVLFARTSKSLARCHEQLRNHTMEKIYYALVEGKVSKERGTLTHDVKKGHFKGKVEKGGKTSTLEYEVVKETQQGTLVKIRLKTGRYHQIRIQWAHMGHPICGDTKYGSHVKADQICLHHAELTFDHPISKERIRLTDYSAPFFTW